MGILTEYDHQQMRVNAARMPLCVGKYRKIAHVDGNWEIYYWPKYKFCVSLAKPESGALSSTLGNLAHVRHLVQEGKIKSSGLTKLGRRLMKQFE